jgi:hypothetical protein
MVLLLLVVVNYWLKLLLSLMTCPLPPTSVSERRPPVSRSREAIVAVTAVMAAP